MGHSHFVESRVIPGEVSAIEASTDFAEPHFVLFDVLEWTEGVRLLACCSVVSEQWKEKVAGPRDASCLAHLPSIASSSQLSLVLGQGVLARAMACCPGHLSSWHLQGLSQQLLHLLRSPSSARTRDSASVHVLWTTCACIEQRTRDCRSRVRRTSSPSSDLSLLSSFCLYTRCCPFREFYHLLTHICRSSCTHSRSPLSPASCESLEGAHFHRRILQRRSRSCSLRSHVDASVEGSSR